jgi:2-methylcitrate dehydratase PrpD
MTDKPARLDRRAVLGAALLAPVALAPAGAAAAEASQDADPRRPVDAASGASLALARHVAECHVEDLPPEALRVGARSLLDAIGVSLAASGEEPTVRPFIDHALEEGRGGKAVIVGTGRRATVGLAALANGSLAHAMDYEDAHDPSRTHPNAAPVAVAVAMGSGLRGITGHEALAAVVIGADVACRLSMAQGNVDDLPKAFYPPSIAGTMGATATAARLLKLTPAQTLDAFSIALCQNACSAEILSDAYSDLRAVRDGFSAQVGVQAAQLAGRGVKGFSRPIEGERGFFAMYAGGREVPGVITRELGRRFEGQFVGYKAWPACRDTHPYIQAVLDGQARDHIDPTEIESIIADVPSRSLIVSEPKAEKRLPRAAIDAKFSLYFTVATTLLHGRVNFASFAPAALQDAATLQLAARVDYRVVKGPARLTLKLRDGRVIEWLAGPLYGAPENPMDEAALRAKFIDCAGMARRAPRLALTQLADRLLGIADETNLPALLRVL